MILADKIIALRKKAGWSQEELAQQLGVTRQSVSKLEGAQSIPDLDKILQISRIFANNTDIKTAAQSLLLCALFVLLYIYPWRAGQYAGDNFVLVGSGKGCGFGNIHCVIPAAAVNHGLVPFGNVCNVRNVRHALVHA